MSKTQKHDGWSLNQGLAAQYAAQAGLDPDMAADAGEQAWDVLKSLRDAVDERDPVRKRKRVLQTKRRLKKAGLSRHTALVKAIHGRLASLRRADDEGVKPSINPKTGLQEFSVECADEGGCRQDPVGYRGPNIYDYGGTTYVNVTGTSTSPTGQYDAYSGDNWAGQPGGTGPLPYWNDVPVGEGSVVPDPTNPNNTQPQSPDDETASQPTDIHGDRPFSNYLSGLIDESILDTWTDDQLRNELENIEGWQIPGEVDTIGALSTFGRNGLPGAGLNAAYYVINRSITAGRIRAICARRGVVC